MLAKLLTVKAAAVALGMLAAGGVAAAATGTLPAPAQQVAHAVLGRAGVPASSESGASTTTASTATTVTTTAAQAHAWTRAAVRLAVEEQIDELPEKFTTDLYERKCDAVYQHVFDSYWDDGRSIYDQAA